MTRHGSTVTGEEMMEHSASDCFHREEAAETKSCPHLRLGLEEWGP
jgi:hypothetical protein